MGDALGAFPFESWTLDGTTTADGKTKLFRHL
jgi:hypothetical protein